MGSQGRGRQLSSKEAAARSFNRWAPRYERDVLSRRIATLQRRALDALDLGANDRLLDVGCGTGAGVRAAARRSETVVGLDLSEQMLSRAETLASGLANVEFVNGDAERLPFADDSFTALLCTSSLHHYPEPDRALGEFSRVLASGGRIALGDFVADRGGSRIVDALLRRFERGHIGFQRTNDLRALLSEAGFHGGSTTALWLGSYAILTGTVTDGWGG